jgi:hypothetical protein
MIAAIVLCAALGAPPGSAVEREAVRVYMNADLEALGPVPTQAAPIVDEARDADWRFVIEWLEREHARIDADRGFLLDSERLDIEAQRVERERERFVLPLAFGVFRTWPWCFLPRHPYPGCGPNRPRGPALPGAPVTRPRPIDVGRSAPPVPASPVVVEREPFAPAPPLAVARPPLPIRARLRLPAR